mmetsp:Transcript_16335/g.24605  ORF Transcript_16335/g.24605 Transcript_16335/m.24605 type:complete len:230 (-) Transcript_16335:327-1016(-)
MTIKLACGLCAFTLLLFIFSPSQNLVGTISLRSPISTLRCPSRVRVSAEAPISRRAIGQGALTTGLAVIGGTARAADPLCGDNCVSDLERVPLQKTISGLEYRDIKVGQGDVPPKAFDVVVHYTLSVETKSGLKEFFSSLDGRPLDIRVGTGMVIPGLDEGLSTMRSGGVRRLYIPGSLSFPKGVKAKPGSPSVPPFTPIVADVQLIYIPGLDDDLVIQGGEDDASASE